MERLLYYPGFEIQDERWLKFALLYLEEVNTIIPYEADGHLSEVHNLLLEETNLLTKYRPDFQETEKSSNDAIECLTNLLKVPERNFGILGRINVNEYWQKRYNQTFEIYSGKFSFYFADFCKEHGFSHDTENGIKIPYQLGLIYMTILAHNIGDHKDISIITDIIQEKSLASINSKTWKYNKKYEEIKAVKKIIELELPRNIDDIDIMDIVRLRNKSGYLEKLHAFKQAVSELDRLKNVSLNERNYQEIIHYIRETKTSLIGELINFGSSLLAVYLGVTICISDNSSNQELIKELAGMGAVLNGSLTIAGKLGERTPNRLANRYLTEIREISSTRNQRRGAVS